MQFNGAALSDTRVNDSKVFINRTFDFSDQVASTLRDELVSFGPHIVVLAGSSDVVTKIMGPVDDLLTFKPYYLLADGAFGDELSGVLAEKQASGLPARVRITAPGTSGATFNSFLSRYSARFSPVDGDADGGTVFGAAGAYDATYLLALALSSISTPNISGATVAAALPKTANTTAGDVFDVQFNNDVGEALTTMSQGGTINYTGASGPLDFDIALGEAQSDIQIFCADPTDPATLNPTGQSYNALNKALEGSESGCQ
jgi:ABC-type branched-subunit amino acid transport system substrate-binding protein